EQALNRYTGTRLYVSHYRYLVNQTPTRIWELAGDTFINYIGNYDYYLEKKDVLTQAALNSEQSSAQIMEESSSKLNLKQQKERKAKERKRQADLKKIEDTIARFEKRSEDIDELLTHEEVFSNVTKLIKLNKEKEEIQTKLETLME